MPDRPDYIHCIRQSRETHKGKSWCERQPGYGEWTFMSIDHAANTILYGSRLLPCPECVAKIVGLLTQG